MGGRQKGGASRLTTVYYRNFLLLVVLPLALVIFGTLWLMQESTIRSANEKIQIAQSSVIDAFTTEIEVASLKLSHFLISNNNRALELAAHIVSSTGQQKYSHITSLKELYNSAVTPSSDIIAIHFYAVNGEIFYLKDALTIPLEDVRGQAFYGQALAQPDQTSVGAVPANFMYMNKALDNQRMTLVIAFAPRRTESSGMLEMVCMYINSQINGRMQQYSRDPDLGKFYLLNDAGETLISPDKEQNHQPLPQAILGAEPGSHALREGGKTRQYTVSVVPSTGWKLISVVDNDMLLAGFYRIAWGVLGISVALFTLFFVFSIIFLRNIIAPINRLTGGMQMVKNGEMDTRVEPIGLKELRSLTESFNSMIRTAHMLMRTNEEHQQAKHRAEIQALQSQINPHFLVNTLGNIRFMAMVAKYDGMRRMTEALMSILTVSFRRSVSRYTLREEMEVLESYIYLMKIRYAENFEVHIDIGENCKRCEVPCLILQPIVENAIVHGFEKKTDIGHVTIAGRRKGEALVITIADDGQGMSIAQAQALLSADHDAAEAHGSIGIVNVHRRIRLNYGDEYGVAIHSVIGVGTVMTLTLPALEREEGTIDECADR